MSPAPSPMPSVAAAATGYMGDLLLQVAGKGAGRMLTAKRHVGILEAAFPLLDKDQQIIARRRINHLEERWGPLGNGCISAPASNDQAEGNHSISPELRTARWLSKRRAWSRYLRILHRAACYFGDGGTSLTDAQEYAYKLELDGVVADVGLSSFTEWMIELRIAERTANRVYGPGSLCEWWANEMASTRSQSSALATCMDLASEICRRSLSKR